MISASLLSALLLVAAADVPQPKGYACVRARTPVAVDGRLDDAAWADAAWTDDFVDIEGDAKPRPRYRTRVKMLWDDDAFYVAAEMEEPHAWATLTAHDSVIFRDNDFEVFIDPDGDNHNYEEIEVNAFNTTWDLFLPKPYRDGGSAQNSREILGMRTATRVSGRINDPGDVDAGWSVELSFPWKSLADHAGTPCPPRDGDRWRVNFSRVEWEHVVESGAYKKVPNRPEANWVWSPQGVVNMHVPERWGYVQFTSEPPSRARFLPDPAGPARDRLMQIYQAEASLHDAGKPYADSLDALGLAGRPAPAGAGLPSISLTPKGFEASITVLARDGSPARTWTVREDSLIQSRPAASP